MSAEQIKRLSKEWMQACVGYAHGLHDVAHCKKLEAELHAAIDAAVPANEPVAPLPSAETVIEWCAQLCEGGVDGTDPKYADACRTCAALIRASAKESLWQAERASPQAVPVAWMAKYVDLDGRASSRLTTHYGLACEEDADRNPVPLYTAPQAVDAPADEHVLLGMEIKEMIATEFGITGGTLQAKINKLVHMTQVALDVWQAAERACDSLRERAERGSHATSCEPVAWMTPESRRRLKQGGNCKGAVPVHGKRSNTATIPLYALKAPAKEGNADV